MLECHPHKSCEGTLSDNTLKMMKLMLEQNLCGWEKKTLKGGSIYSPVSKSAITQLNIKVWCVFLQTSSHNPTFLSTYWFSSCVSPFV